MKSLKIVKCKNENLNQKLEVFSHSLNLNKESDDGWNTHFFRNFISMVLIVFIYSC